MEFDRDYDRHNEEVKKVWETYNAKKPLRMPVILGVNNRIILLDSKLNTKGYTFEQYFHDPVIMTEVCCECEYQLRHNIYADHDMECLKKDGQSLPINRTCMNVDGLARK